MSAPSKRTRASRAAQANAVLARLAAQLGPCELVAILPRRSPRRRGGMYADAAGAAEESQVSRAHAGKGSTR